MQLFLFVLVSKLRKYLVFFSPSSYHFACDHNIAPLVMQSDASSYFNFQFSSSTMISSFGLLATFSSAILTSFSRNSKFAFLSRIYCPLFCFIFDEIPQDSFISKAIVFRPVFPPRGGTPLYGLQVRAAEQRYGFWRFSILKQGILFGHVDIVSRCDPQIGCLNLYQQNQQSK